MSVFRQGRIWWFNFYFKGVRYQESTRATTRDEALQAESIRKAALRSAGARGGKPHAAGFTNFANKDFETWCAIERKERPSTYAR